MFTTPSPTPSNVAFPSCHATRSASSSCLVAYLLKSGHVCPPSRLEVGWQDSGYNHMAPVAAGPLERDETYSNLPRRMQYRLSTLEPTATACECAPRPELTTHLNSIIRRPCERLPVAPKQATTKSKLRKQSVGSPEIVTCTDPSRCPSVAKDDGYSSKCRHLCCIHGIPYSRLQPQQRITCPSTSGA